MLIFIINRGVTRFQSGGIGLLDLSESASLWFFLCHLFIWLVWGWGWGASTYITPTPRVRLKLQAEP